MSIYLDNNATTALDPRVLDAMQPYFLGPYGNPSSVHRQGRMARDAIEGAREQVARLVGGRSSEVVWSSGATEANNLALKGAARASPRTGDEQILYAATEHPAAMEAAGSLRGEGWLVDAIPVDEQGKLRWPEFTAQLARGRVRIASVMVANNETGVIQDLGRAAACVHDAGGLLLADAVQAAGKIPVSEYWTGANAADLMSLSAHKINGPKGVGALLVKSGVALATQLHGGGQERGLRGGTENLAGIVGFGAAAELALEEQSSRAEQWLALRERLEAGLATIPGLRIFGDAAPRLPNTVQFAIPGWEGEALLMALDRKGIAVSSGSACASGTGEPSHVLLAMGFARDVAFGAIRVSLGLGNAAAEIDQFVRVLTDLARMAAAA